MSSVLVIFGSRSDERIFKAIMDKAGDAELRILSAHRAPDLLRKALNESRSRVIIAGAGLAAHLPGVIASETFKPVIGVPCDGNYGGLDALLSIMQMPSGIPVLGVGVNNGEEAVRAAGLMMKHFSGINLVGKDKLSVRHLAKLEDAAKKLGAEVSMEADAISDKVNIRPVLLDSGPVVPDNGMMTINVPVKEASSSEDALRLLEMTKTGIWVGLNRLDNAVIAACEIMQDQYGSQLSRFRREMRAGFLKGV